MNAQYLINEKAKSTRAMNGKILEARALQERIACFLSAEQTRNEKSILNHKPVSTWADAGDMDRVLHLLKDTEGLLAERSQNQ